jgi:hypothetical protein
MLYFLWLFRLQRLYYGLFYGLINNRLLLINDLRVAGGSYYHHVVDNFIITIRRYFEICLRFFIRLDSYKHFLLPFLIS